MKPTADLIDHMIRHRNPRTVSAEIMAMFDARIKQLEIALHQVKTGAEYPDDLGEIIDAALEGT